MNLTTILLAYFTGFLPGLVHLGLIILAAGNKLLFSSKVKRAEVLTVAVGVVHTTFHVIIISSGNHHTERELNHLHINWASSSLVVSLPSAE
jgi:uncharacterized membrane protein YdcZ (DUF606 family)